MNWLEFSARLGFALLLGGMVGLERQWRQRGAGLGTNALVSMGAALFVMLSVMTPGDSSPTRIAAHVVSGIGFLGEGVILHKGSTVRGLDTAATLWCAAALGCLCGAGFQQQAFIGSLAILVSNILLRPLVNQINKASITATKRSQNQGDFVREPNLNTDQTLGLDLESNAVYINYEKDDNFRSSFSSKSSEIDSIEQSIIDNFKREKELESYCKQSTAKNLEPNQTPNPRPNRSSNFKQDSMGSSRKCGPGSSRWMSKTHPKFELATVYFNLGNARVQLQDKRGAIADLQKAAKLYLALCDTIQYLQTIELLKKISSQSAVMRDTHR